MKLMQHRHCSVSAEFQTSFLKHSIHERPMAAVSTVSLGNSYNAEAAQF